MNEAGPTEVARRLRADLARVEELKTRANERGWRLLKAKNEWKARAEAAEARVQELEAENARLIAAAPEMLAALKLLDVWFNPTGSSINARWERIPPVDRLAIVKATRAALAKAEGRSDA